MVLGSTPIFATTDVEATIRFYKDVLGFKTSWTWGEPVTFGSVSWGSAEIMLSLQPDLAARVAGHQHWVNVEEVDALYGEHVERGAKIVSPIEDKPWGVREYIVEDPSGYHLRFAGSLTTTAERSRPFPEGVKILREKPAKEDYDRVLVAAFGNEGGSSEAFERGWAFVSAASPEGELIGSARIMFDAPGWYSVWDVAVVPDWQGCRIGSALMKEALEVVREASPGAFVYLFTFKHAFYERFGFTKQTVSMVKV